MSFPAATGRPATWLFSCTLVGARRGYAKPANGQYRKRPPPSSSPSPSSPRPQQQGAPSSPDYGTAFSASGPPRLLFSRSDVPTIRTFEGLLQSWGNQDLTARQCFDGAMVYVSLATQHESQWRHTLVPKWKLSTYFLHWLGVLIRGHKSATGNPEMLGTHMLRSASELGYAPSTITLMKFFSMMPTNVQDKYRQHKLFRSSAERFQQIVKQGKDPNAISLQGSILKKQGAADQALRCFREARRVWAADQGMSAASTFASPAPCVQLLKNGQVTFPTPRSAHWEWELTCILGEADILKERGHHEQARSLYNVAALELDSASGFSGLASLVEPRDSPERRAYLLKAAVSGDVGACRELGSLGEMAALEKGITEREKESRLFMSNEWKSLANPQV